MFFYNKSIEFWVLAAGLTILYFFNFRLNLKIYNKVYQKRIANDKQNYFSRFKIWIFGIHLSLILLGLDMR
jgi:hypothetical protein